MGFGWRAVEQFAGDGDLGRLRREHPNRDAAVGVDLRRDDLWAPEVRRGRHRARPARRSAGARRRRRRALGQRRRRNTK